MDICKRQGLSILHFWRAKMALGVGRVRLNPVEGLDPLINKMLRRHLQGITHRDSEFAGNPILKMPLMNRGTWGVCRI